MHNNLDIIRFTLPSIAGITSLNAIDAIAAAVYSPIPFNSINLLLDDLEILKNSYK